MPSLLVLVVLNFFLSGNGTAITWLFNQLYSWWEGVLGV